MKSATLALTLILMSAQAQEPTPYPETVPVAEFPFLAHWQLTMVSHAEMIDIDARGFENVSRMSCIRAGIERILEQEESAPDFIPQQDRWLGFVCEYIRPND